MSDLSIFFPRLLINTQQMRATLSENSLSLPANAFVFMHRYGEQMLFFEQSPPIADPPVYHWRDEDPDNFPKVYDSIWEWLEDELEGYEYCVG